MEITYLNTKANYLYLYVYLSSYMKLIPILLNEFTETVIQQLVNKFTEEGGPNERALRIYIDRFKQIKNSPKVTKKDPFQYTWKEFEQIVDANRQVDIKAGKLDPTAEDANLIYNKDGIRVYVGKDKKACIKYGNGYSFCISARGEDNLYDDYRTSTFDVNTTMDDEEREEPVGNTPYFVFNDNLTSERKGSSFIEPNHVLVIFVGVEVTPSLLKRHGIKKALKEYPKIYSVTDANNRGEVYYSFFKHMVTRFPWLAPLEKIIKPVDIDKSELKKYLIEKELDKDLKDLRRDFNNRIEPIFSTKVGNRGFGNFYREATLIQGWLNLFGLDQLLSMIDNEELQELTFTGRILNSIGQDLEKISQRRYIKKGDQRQFKKQRKEFEKLLSDYSDDPSDSYEVEYYDSTKHNSMYQVIKEPLFIKYIKDVDRLEKATQSALNKIDLGVE